MVSSKQKVTNKKLVIFGLAALSVLLVVAGAVFYLRSQDTQLSGNAASADDDVPPFLLASFPNTDWSQTSEQITKALSGGPGKDGIPAIDNPQFINLSEYERSDSIQVIAVQHGDTTKLYPYNILVWHEIVNDTIEGKPVIITFCPLCGSAIVFDRTLPDGNVTTFGVSGALVESNLVMYDRESETLWQQSTGEALAGTYLGHELELGKFQLMTVREAKSQYGTDALVLSEDTGHNRDYTRNPYSGYEGNDDFIFSPSNIDERYPSKEVFVAFDIEGTPIAAPWLEIKNGESFQTEIKGQTITLDKMGSELEVTDDSGNEIPFYFEMWFSWAVQHQDDGIVYDPTK